MERTIPKVPVSDLEGYPTPPKCRVIRTPGFFEWLFRKKISVYQPEDKVNTLNVPPITIISDQEMRFTPLAERWDTADKGRFKLCKDKFYH